MGGVSSSIIDTNVNTPLVMEKEYKLIDPPKSFEDLKIQEIKLNPTDIENIKKEKVEEAVIRDKRNFSNVFYRDYQKLIDLIQTVIILDNYSEKNKVILDGLKEEIHQIENNDKHKKELNQSHIITILHTSKKIDSLESRNKFLTIVSIILLIIAIAQLVLIIKK